MAELEASEDGTRQKTLEDYVANQNYDAVQLKFPSEQAMERAKIFD